jgi:ABC-type multidrug transport system fused ATPase/permease subunit
MNKLIPTGIIFLILSAFVSPAIAADSIQREKNEYQVFTVKSDEKTTKLLESLEEKQNVRVYNAESEEDLIKIAASLSEYLKLDEHELLKSVEQSIEQPSDRASVDLLEKLITDGNPDLTKLIIITNGEWIIIIIIIYI